MSLESAYASKRNYRIFLLKGISMRLKQLTYGMDHSEESVIILNTLIKVATVVVGLALSTLKNSDWRDLYKLSYQTELQYHRSKDKGDI